MIQYQILLANIIRIVWHIVRRITNEILGVKGLIISIVRGNKVIKIYIGSVIVCIILSIELE